MTLGVPWHPSSLHLCLHVAFCSLCLLSSHEGTCHWIQGIFIQDGLISTSLVIPAKTLYLNKLTVRGTGWTYILGEPSLNPLHVVNLDMLPCVLTFSFLRKTYF